MKINRRTGNILTFGVTLLVILSAAMLLVGLMLNDIGAKMNSEVVKERSQTHYNIIKGEFEKTLLAEKFAASYLAKEYDGGASAGNTLSKMLFELDPKISRFSLFNKNGEKLLSFGNPGSSNIDKCGSAVRNDMPDTLDVRSGICRNEEYVLWSLSRRIETGREQLVFRIDIDLQDMFSYMALQDTRVMSYVSIFNSDGLILLHPDNTLIGKTISDEGELKIIGEVSAKGGTKETTVVSEYLVMNVERYYFPFEIGSERWVVAVSVPWITIGEEMRQFHTYTAIIAVLAVLIFSALLAFSQSRWRREYKARVKAERLSDELQMQQIIDQMKPHFLFNSLNSLYALINQDAKLSREFVLKLSGVYRYILEKRQEVLSTVEKEMEFTTQYMFLQKIRFGGQIRLSVEISPEYKEHLLPTLGIQTLVENAIKHNAFSPDAPLNITIRTEREFIFVENDFIPGKQIVSESTGVGLERLRSIYKLYTDKEIIIVEGSDTYLCGLPLLRPEK